MAKVDNPEFKQEDGEVDGCVQCPLDKGPLNSELCEKWWNRITENQTGAEYLTCPTAETYEEACKFAEENTVTLEPKS